MHLLCFTEHHYAAAGGHKMSRRASLLVGLTLDRVACMLFARPVGSIWKIGKCIVYNEVELAFATVLQSRAHTQMTGSQDILRGTYSFYQYPAPAVPWP